MNGNNDKFKQCVYQTSVFTLYEKQSTLQNMFCNLLFRINYVRKLTWRMIY